MRSRRSDSCFNRPRYGDEIARAVPGLRAALDAGETSVRELGGLGIALAQAVEEGVSLGPAVYPAGAWLSPTGGHADLHEVPLVWVHELAAKAGELRQCDGTAFRKVLSCSSSRFLRRNSFNSACLCPAMPEHRCLVKSVLVLGGWMLLQRRCLKWNL